MISEERSGNEYLQCSCYLYLLESQLFGGKKTVFRRNIYIVASIKESWLKSVEIIFASEEFKSISGDVVDTDTNTAEIYRKRVTETDRINNGNYQAVELECPTDLSESCLPLGLGVFLDIESTDFSAARTQDDSSTSDDDGDDDDDDDDDDDEYADATDDINGNIYLVNDQSTTFEREPNAGIENVGILTNTEETDKDEKEKTTSNNSEIGEEEEGQGEEGIEKEGGGGGGEKIEEKETEEKREEKEEREEKEKQEEQEEKEKEEEIEEKEKEEEIEEKEKEEEREEKEKDEEREEKEKDEEREEKEKVEKQEEKEKDEEREENALAVVVEEEKEKIEERESKEKEEKGKEEELEEKEKQEGREEKAKEEEREENALAVVVEAEKEKIEEREEKEKEEENALAVVVEEKEKIEEREAKEKEEKEKQEESEEKEKQEEKEKEKEEELEEKEKREEKEKEEEREGNALAVVVEEEEEEEEEEEKVGERKINKPQKTSRKKRSRNRRKSRKRRTKPPQLRETPSSGDACAMSTRTTSTVVSATRPLTLPLSLALPLTLPIRPLSLSPLHDGPIKTTTPDSTRSLYPMPTLAVINEQESIDDEPLNANETQKEIDANSIKDKQRSPRTPKLSPTSAILNDNVHDRISFNNNNTIPDDNINNNTSNNNDNNNNKNNICKIITSDFEEINADYNYDRHYAEVNDSHIEFKNEYLNNNNRLAANFSGLYRLENSAESYSGEINASPGLEGVKAMANRLNLATRRPSYQQWRDRYFGSGGVPRFPDLSPEELTAEKLTEERKGRINGALEWIKNELGQMRAVDHNLATQLLTLRNDISRLKLERSCESHQDLLDDVKDELSDRETISAVSDIPYDMADDNPLKHLGVTRMNISSRRFSMC